MQKTRDDARSVDGSWNLVDVIGYIRAQIKRARQSHESAEEPAAHEASVN